jgi:hypothetical protein
MNEPLLEALMGVIVVHDFLQGSQVSSLGASLPHTWPSGVLPG